MSELEYYYNILIFICIYWLLAQAFNLNFGLGGQFNLAHVATYAIGAYTTALLSTGWSNNFFLVFLLSGLLAGLFALIIGAISTKLSNDYFAIGTLAFSSIVSALLINWRSLTNGVLGISGIPRPTIFGHELVENSQFLLLLVIIVLLIQQIFYFIFRSFYSRQLKAQAEFEPAALALGIKTFFIRQTSFFISAFFAGLAGSFYAYYINYIDPSSFGLHEMVFVLTIVVIGRPGSFWGCLFACIFLQLLPEFLRRVDIDPSILGPMRQLLYALILYTFVYINRARLFPVKRAI